jgi:hypothetical protein
MRTNNQLFKKVEQLAEGVKKDFRSKGLVIPVLEDDGSVRFDDYTVTRNKQGFYVILNLVRTPIVENINLPQTAIILANNLAIGKMVDDKILDHDKQYGFSLFEEEQYTRIAQSSAKKQDWERVDTLIIKKNIAHIRAESAKKNILSSFEKFRRLR